MAVIFGGKNRYLFKKLLTVFVVGFLGLVVLSLISFAPTYFSWLGLGGVFFVCIILILQTRLIAFANKKFNRLSNGLNGEDRIAKELNNLPDNYAVFRGIKISEHQDVDYAVVGPTGVFAVEVKSHKGQIGFNGQELTRSGRRFQKDFFRETMAEATGLRGLISRDAKIDVFVEPVIVFSRAKISLGSQKIRGCYVIGVSWLNALVQSKATYQLNDEFIFKISSALARLVRDKHNNDKIKQLEKTFNNSI
jgi:hypothetical protein